MNDYHTMLSVRHQREEAARHYKQAQLEQEAKVARPGHDPLLRLLRQTRMIRISLKRAPQPLYNPCQEAKEAVG